MINKFELLNEQKEKKIQFSVKTEVVLEALKERHTLQDLASKYDLHSSQVVNWKKDFLAIAFSKSFMLPSVNSSV